MWDVIWAFQKSSSSSPRYWVSINNYSHAILISSSWRLGLSFWAVAHSLFLQLEWLAKAFCSTLAFHLLQMSLNIFTSILNSPCGHESPLLCYEHTLSQRAEAATRHNWSHLGLSSQGQYNYLFIGIRLPRAFNLSSTTTTVTGWACHQNALMIEGKKIPRRLKEKAFSLKAT